jgi:hypothetical protein
LRYSSSHFNRLGSSLPLGFGIAQPRVRYGYRKIRILLDREGWGRDYPHFGHSRMPCLDRDRMPVQIVKNEPSWLKALFIYEPRHTLTTLEAVIVIHDQSTIN